MTAEIGVTVASRFEPGTVAYLHQRHGGTWDADTAGTPVAEEPVGDDGSVAFVGLEEAARFWVVGETFDGRTEGVCVTAKAVVTPEEQAERLAATRPVTEDRGVVHGARNTSTARARKASPKRSGPKRKQSS